MHKHQILYKKGTVDSYCDEVKMHGSLQTAATQQQQLVVGTMGLYDRRRKVVLVELPQLLVYYCCTRIYDRKTAVLMHQ